MSERAKLITEQALALSVEERERLYETLLLSLQEGSEQDEAEFRELGTRRASAETNNVPITAWMIPTAQSDAPPSSAAVQRMTMAASTL